MKNFAVRCLRAVALADDLKGVNYNGVKKRPIDKEPKDIYWRRCTCFTRRTQNQTVTESFPGLFWLIDCCWVSCGLTLPLFLIMICP